MTLRQRAQISRDDATTSTISRQHWTTGPARSEIREVAVPEPGPGEVLVETMLSGISRGTETLVHQGLVPDEVAHLMRAPHQLGDLPHPVSHGYLNVGVVRAVNPDPPRPQQPDPNPPHPERLLGRVVFTLAGHRDHVIVPVADCHPVPDGCPPERALLAGAAETGLNALWESQATLGDRVAVVGGGMIGLATALLASTLPLERLQVVEQDADRRTLITSLGLSAVAPGQASGDGDVGIHASASEDGLREALSTLGDDATLVELSWYGARSPQVPLGADFHARRLRILGSQVGEVAQPRRLRRTRRQRLQFALQMLDERFDTLITGRSPLRQLPTLMTSLAEDAPPVRGTICHVIDHGCADTDSTTIADATTDAEPVHGSPTGD